MSDKNEKIKFSIFPLIIIILVIIAIIIGGSKWNFFDFLIAFMIIVNLGRFYFYNIM